MFRCCSLETSHPRLLPQSLKDCSISLCLFFCSAYRVIINIFLNLFNWSIVDLQCSVSCKHTANDSFMHTCVHCCCLGSKLCPTLLWLHELYSPRPLCPQDFPARILEWVAISSSRGILEIESPVQSSWPRDWTHVSCIGRRILYHWATREAHTYTYIHTYIHTYILFFRFCSIIGYCKVLSIVPCVL